MRYGERLRSHVQRATGNASILTQLKLKAVGRRLRNPRHTIVNVVRFGSNRGRRRHVMVVLTRLGLATAIRLVKYVCGVVCARPDSVCMNPIPMPLEIARAPPRRACTGPAKRNLRSDDPCLN